MYAQPPAAYPHTPDTAGDAATLQSLSLNRVAGALQVALAARRSARSEERRRRHAATGGK
jgi:hypothetical protein